MYHMSSHRATHTGEIRIALMQKHMSCRCTRTGTRTRCCVQAHTSREACRVDVHTRPEARCMPCCCTRAHAHDAVFHAQWHMHTGEMPRRDVCYNVQPHTHTHGRDACRVTVDAHVYAHVHGRDRCRVKLHAHECMLGGAYSRPGVPARRTLPSDSHRLLKARGHSIQHLREFLITQAAAVQAGSEVRRLCVMHRDEHR